MHMGILWAEEKGKQESKKKITLEHFFLIILYIVKILLSNMYFFMYLYLSNHI